MSESQLQAASTEADLDPETSRKPAGRRATHWIMNIREVWLVVILLGLATLVFTAIGSAYTVFTYVTFLLAAMGAISLQVLQGTSGLISIGNSAFLLIGAFGTVFANKQGFGFPLDIVGGVLISGVAGCLVGIPAIRLRSLFLALSTIAAFFLALFVAQLYQQHFPEAAESGFFLPITFSSHGLLGQDQRWAWLMFIVVALVVIGANRLMNERSGRALRMLRDHELLAPTLGVSVTQYKLGLFTISSMVIGLQGALTAYLVGIVSSGNYTVGMAFQYIAMIVIGGLDSLMGAVLGAAIVIGLPVALPPLITPFFGSQQASIDAPNVALIVYGALVVVCVALSPNGLVGFFNTLKQRAARRRIIAAE
jgi:branched-chain amino acid transport system permease protein